MTTESSVMVGAYLAKGIIGNVGMPGAPIVHFSLVVVPSQHKVSGSVHVTQAIAGGSYSGEVTGKIYATGLGNVTQVVGLQGTIHPDGPEPIEIPFDAHMAIDGAWNGTGGFNYANVHVESAPVAISK